MSARSYTLLKYNLSSRLLSTEGICMELFSALGLIATIIYFLANFARQEAVEVSYNEAINDIEGRLDWARSRTTYPFGMSSNIVISTKLLQQAKSLWHGNKYHQAYQVACQSQQALDKAQCLYISSLTVRSKITKKVN